MTYYAVKTTLSDGTEVILRLAVRSSQVTSYITALVPLLIVVLVVLSNKFTMRKENAYGCC
jgi:hypothetical protein